MKRKLLCRLMLSLLLTLVFLPFPAAVYAETAGIAVPSLGESLQRYPDSETGNEDGSTTELYTSITDAEIDAFSAYLERQGAELVRPRGKKNPQAMEIRAKGASATLEYDSTSGEARVTYPAGTYDERTQRARDRFETAVSLLQAGKTDEAYAAFFSIPQFRAYGPVDSLLKTDAGFAAAAAEEAKYEPYQTAGSVVVFGAYPQAAEGTDRTPIEWIVLDYDGINRRTLLLSRHGLDAVPYHTGRADITWEECTLRAWLNEDFFRTAFSEEEQRAIVATETDNSSGQGYSGWSAAGGNNTQDRVFLLSCAEAYRYLGVRYWQEDDGGNTASRTAPTAYAAARGAWTGEDLTADGEVAGWWWLRSPGSIQNGAACVGRNGSFYMLRVDYSAGTARPAVWIDLDSDVF